VTTKIDWKFLFVSYFMFMIALENKQEPHAALTRLQKAHSTKKDIFRLYL